MKKLSVNLKHILNMSVLNFIILYASLVSLSYHLTFYTASGQIWNQYPGHLNPSHLNSRLTNRQILLGQHDAITHHHIYSRSTKEYESDDSSEVIVIVIVACLLILTYPMLYWMNLEFYQNHFPVFQFLTAISLIFLVFCLVKLISNQRTTQGNAQLHISQNQKQSLKITADRILLGFLVLNLLAQIVVAINPFHLINFGLGFVVSLTVLNLLDA